MINALHSMGIHWRPIPTEAPWGICRSERHHRPIQDAYTRRLAETPRLAPDLALAMAYKARNDAPRAHGIAPTTAVTGEPPRLLTEDNMHADPSIAARSAAMQAARASMERHTAADRLRGALSHPGTTVPFVQVGQTVWIHRDRHGWLRGVVHSLDGKTVYVLNGNKIFSAHEARTKPLVSHLPPLPARYPDHDAPAPPTRPLDPIRTQTPAPPPAAALPPTTHLFLAEPTDPSSHRHPRWDAAKRTELAIFEAIDCKYTIPLHEVPHGKQVFPFIWRVTHKPNRGNGKPPERARFCMVGNRDWNKHTNVPTSPVTPQRAIRTIMAAASILRFNIHMEDVLHAYLQSDLLPEPVYVRIPPEAGEPDSHVWAFTRAIYGKDDAGRHFHFSTQAHYLAIPGIVHSAAFDTIYLIPGQGALCTYVDDTFSAGTRTFDVAVAAAMQDYNTHRPDRGNVTFAGLTATTDDAGIHCSAGPYTSTLRPAPTSDRPQDLLDSPTALHSLAAQLLWVCRCARPDVLTNATNLANLPTSTSLDARHANDTLAILTRRPITLHFPRLHRPSLRLSIYADYSGSAKSPPGKRQVGYLAALTDNTHRFSLLHWASHGPRRVCRGSTAGELLALADAYAASLDVRLHLQELLDQRIPIDAYTDSATTYELVTSFKDPADMSGKNDLHLLRRALLGGDLAEVNHIHGHHNPADALSKPSFSRPAPTAALSDALTSGTLDTPVVSHTTTDGYGNQPRAGIHLA